MRLSGLPHRSGNRGYALIEALVYFGVVVVLLAIAYLAMDRCITNSMALRRAADDIGNALRAGERWRADMRLSTQTRWQDIEGSRVLRLSTQQGEIQYRWEAGALGRRVGNGPWTIILNRVKMISISPEPREHVAAWRCEMELEPRRKSARVQPLFTFYAVPAASL
jgi:Tfp pilus assembly protein PilE